MSHKNLITALITKLRDDTGAGSLVALTGHNGTTIRIARDQPPMKERLPFLGVAVFVSMPLIGPDATHVKQSRLHFRVYDRIEIGAHDIMDRVDTLLDDKTSDANTGYYDFSTTDISIRQNRWVSRKESIFDEEKEVWEGLVEADVIWVNETCPSP